MVVVYILLAVSIIVGMVGIVFSFRKGGHGELSSKDKKEILDGFDRNVMMISKVLTDNQNSFKESLNDRQENLEKRMAELGERLERNLKEIREANEKSLKALQEDNSKQLDKMRQTVDEKLSETITARFNESFDVLKKQLESVDKSLGEMQRVGMDVGNLTRMLSNVKTAGIFGEIQLGAIFDEILTKDQYDTNVVTGAGKEPVEFAVKLPGQEEGEYVYLPVDSKFPMTSYREMQTAYEKNDMEAVKACKAKLKREIDSMAKDIKTKYIYPPKTTNFAIMFLATEGLYSEVAKMEGLIEDIQKKYKVTIAGPTTFSALLNSLKMGFRTLILQKKSAEVWKVLSAVRTEFENYNGIVAEIQKSFDQTGKKFDKLVGTRTRMIERKLKDIDKSVERVESSKATEILELEEPEDEE